MATAPAWLRLHGWRVDERLTEHAGHARELAAEAALAGYTAVLAVGGDGTVNEVVNGLAGSETLMAVLPAGTANVWAREVRLPRHPATAARLLDHGSIHRIDLGSVNGHRFLLMASLGVDSIVVNAISPWAKRNFGKWAYVTQGLREAVRYPPVAARITADGVEMQTDMLMLVVGNTRSYGGAVRITNRAVADDGVLDTVVYGGRGAGRMAGYLARTFAGRHGDAPGAAYRRVRTLSVETARPLPIQADGDVVSETPAEIRITPGNLRVLVPPGLTAPLFVHAAEPHTPAPSTSQNGAAG